MTDVLITGAGPAGMTAAVYALRAGLSVTVYEKLFPGGQMNTTPDIENYPGFGKISGYDLSERMKSQAEELGCRFITAEVERFELGAAHKAVQAGGMRCEAATVILAMGSERRKLDIPGEQEFSGRGVSYCAVCDGAFFANKVTAVIGGGNTAVEDALHLAKRCSKVYLIHRRNEFRAGRALLAKLEKSANIELILDSIPISISGSAQVEALRVLNKLTDETRDLHLSGVFAAVGTRPQTALLKGVLEMDEQGFISCAEDCKTSVPGVFAAGDIRTKPLAQIVTACADGAVAAHGAYNYLMESLS